MKSNITRRTFIKSSTALSISAAMYLTGCGSSSSSSSTTKNDNNTTQPDTQPPQNSVNPNITKSKALVYIMLGGGNDSFNMLVPTSTAAYSEYQTIRSNLAIAKNDLRTLSDFTDKNNKTFGVHPAMDKVQTLFNDKKLSFISNAGPLIEKTTKLQFQNNSAKIPLGLMSHADQIKHWQTSRPDVRTNIGLFGKLADQFQANKSNTQISMNISLGGTNILQNGINSTEYSITKNGSIGLKVKETTSDQAMQDLNNALLESFNKVLNKSYTDPFESTYMATTKYAQTHHEKFKIETNKVNINHAFTNYDNRTDIKFTTLDKSIGEQFKMIAKSIKASEDLGMNKQTFFIDYYGWDHHDELTNNHKRMLEVLDNALGDFQTALEELEIDDKVVTVVGSDFGRTLTSNGNGTDHGWGGNAIVMGKDIDGGKIFGEYPSLELDNDLDIGGGVIIPTTSTDEIFAELLYWFGVEKDKFTTYLPNIENFYNVSSTDLPIGFLK